MRSSYEDKRRKSILLEELLGLYVPVDAARGVRGSAISWLKGHILFSSANIRYNNQVEDYNKGAKHDDAPDSLYGPVQLVQGVKSIRFYDRSLLF